jgi:hypothetical protein
VIGYLLTYLLTYLPTQWSIFLLEKVTSLQLVKKFPAFYGTRRFITAFTSARHLSVSWARSIHSMPPTSYFLYIHLNITLPSTPGSHQWSLSPQVFHPKSCTRLSPPPSELHAPPISFFSILWPAQKWVRITANGSPHYEVFSTPLSLRPC